jgi:tRNA(Ile)-lysidine synthetase-like protein
VAKRRPSISTAIKQRIPADSRVLVAVSGGRDSMVLLHAILGVRRLLSLEIEVCHVNHRLRPSSVSDATFVEEWCNQRSVTCHVITLDARPLGENLEAWARSERYQAFRRIIERRDLNLLCTAHTANDVAETLLIRLLANKELTSIEEADPRRRCVRPFLEISRSQIDEYVLQHELSYVEDPSNADTSFVRNRVRHQVLPLLQDNFDRSIVWILSERARSLDADSKALQWSASRIIERTGAVEEESFEWLQTFCETVFGVPEGIQWRVVQALFAPLFGYAVGELKARAILRTLVDRAGELDVGVDHSKGEADRGLSLHVGAFGIRIIR